jgi:hypothetical protein
MLSASVTGSLYGRHVESAKGLDLGGFLFCAYCLRVASVIGEGKTMMSGFLLIGVLVLEIILVGEIVFVS